MAFRTDKIYIALLLLLGMLGKNAVGQTTLRYRMTPGENLKYRMTMSMNQRSNADGMNMDMGSNTFSIMHIHCERADSGTFTCTMILDTGTVSLAIPDEIRPSVGLDSVMPIENLEAKRTRITFSPSGHILSFIPLDTPATLNALLKGANLDVEKYTEMFGGLPSKPVAPGDTWTTEMNDSTNLNGMGTMYLTGTTVYTFKRIADTLHHHCAVIGSAATMNVKGAIYLQDVVVSGAGDMTGTIYFDIEKGAMVASTGTGETTSNMELKGEGSMKQTFTSSLEMVLIP